MITEGWQPSELHGAPCRRSSVPWGQTDRQTDMCTAQCPAEVECTPFTCTPLHKSRRLRKLNVYLNKILYFIESLPVN